jgi:hypothetical protein
MIKNTFFLLAISLVVSTVNALAHGITVDVSIESGVVVLNAYYSPAQPLADASVSICSPAEPEKKWQTGRTDKTGHFAFVPDTEGEWSIVIDDQKGHMKRTTVVFTPDLPEEKEITAETITKPIAPAGNGLNTSHKILIGLSLIIGITGFFYGMKARQVRNQK